VRLTQDLPSIFADITTTSHAPCGAGSRDRLGRRRHEKSSRPSRKSFVFKQHAHRRLPQLLMGIFQLPKSFRYFPQFGYVD
jgi:hypothetical protein